MSFIFNKIDAKNNLKELINRFKVNYEFYNNSKYKTAKELNKNQSTKRS